VTERESRGSGEPHRAVVELAIPRRAMSFAKVTQSIKDDTWLLSVLLRVCF
jgi:hypothetical protein